MTRGPAAPVLRPEPNVTPMIDVLLVLLVIAMIAQPLARRAIDAQVPPLMAGEGRGPVPLVLELPDGGGFALNGQPVPAAQLDATLRAVLAHRRARVLFVRAGPARRYQEVISAMDAARGAGADVVALTASRDP